MPVGGALIEIRDADGQLSYMVAEVPDETTLDIKAAEIEAKAEKAKLGATAKQVYDSIPMFARSASTLIGLRDESLGQYQILDKEFFARHSDIVIQTRSRSAWSCDACVTCMFCLSPGSFGDSAIARSDRHRAKEGCHQHAPKPRKPSNKFNR